MHAEYASHASMPLPHCGPTVGGNSEQSGYQVPRPDAPYCKGQGRPDTVILNEEAKKAYLVDVAVPWGSENNVKASRERKVEKYLGVKNCLKQKGFEVLSLSDPS